MLYSTLIFTLIAFSIIFSSTAYADSINLNKQNYVFGDVVIISGKVAFEEGTFIGLQIMTPQKSDIVVIDQFFPKNDGSFSKSYKAQGPKWSNDGTYFVRLVYKDQNYEKTFNFKKLENLENESKTLPTQNTNQTQNFAEPSSEVDTSNPKLRVQGFPDPSNAPNYYLERYSKEQEYRDWFDKSFPNFTIHEIVTYKLTHVTGFPDNSKSPWYYVERYNTEEIYRDWFDSQFPTKSIYEVLDYPEEFFLKVPNWVKNNANWWSANLISDSDFLEGIAYLIKEGILVVPVIPETEYPESQQVPIWVKNIAGWWSEGKIDENEFLKGIQFLVENGIIRA